LGGFQKDGNTVYFTSTRDGYLCIWAQKLHPLTKHPVNAPFVFEHFHNSDGAWGAQSPGHLDLSVSRDKVMIDLPRVNTDIWMSQVE
jgi:hypothetical protein